MKTTLALCLIAGFAGSVEAETFQPREGCTHVVTIQSEGCFVRHVVTCPKVGDGLLVFGTTKNGLVVVTVMDADGATLFQGPKDAMMQLTDRTDLLSLSALTAEGADSFDFTMELKGKGEFRFAGTATLTGETVEVDGRKLSIISTTQVATPPNAEAVETQSVNYLDRELNLILSGETRNTATGKVTVNRTPVEFLFPGEDGALAAEPRIGCEG